MRLPRGLRGGSAILTVGWSARNAVPLLVAPVIVPRPRAGETRDRGLEPPEEPDRLERPVAPSRRDAVVGVVRPLVMRRVLGASQNAGRNPEAGGSAAAAKACAPTGGSGSSSSRSRRTRSRRPRRGLPRRVSSGTAKRPTKHRHRKKGDVAVGVDEAPPEEIVGIDVMHAEGHEQAVPDHRKVVAAPGVGAPVHEPGAEIGRRDPAAKRQRNPPLPAGRAASRCGRPNAPNSQNAAAIETTREEKLRARQRHSEPAAPDLKGPSHCHHPSVAFDRGNLTPLPSHAPLEREAMAPFTDDPSPLG